MRLRFETLSKIKETFGDFEIEAHAKLHTEEKTRFIAPIQFIENSFSFKFGYWDRVSVSKLESLLPNGFLVEEINIDETDEGMFLWVYSIKEKY